MKTMLCPNGHYYNPDGTGLCPYCREIERKNRYWELELKSGGGQGGRDFTGYDEETILPQEFETLHLGRGEGEGKGAIEGIAADEERTVGLDPGKEKGNALITGWLVALNGPNRGRDYRLYYNRNRIGSGPGNEVMLQGVLNAAPKHHCEVVYDRRSRSFYLVPGKDSISYLNGEVLRSPQKLSAYDRIGIGDCVLSFIPFCREEHIWEDEKE